MSKKFTQTDLTGKRNIFLLIWHMNSKNIGWDIKIYTNGQDTMHDRWSTLSSAQKKKISCFARLTNYGKQDHLMGPGNTFSWMGRKNFNGHKEVFRIRETSPYELNEKLFATKVILIKRRLEWWDERHTHGQKKKKNCKKLQEHSSDLSMHCIKGKECC